MKEATNIRARALSSAAHLVAALHDPKYGIKGTLLSEEVRDSIDILRGELDEIGLLKPYRREGGKLGL
ncbi:hypothetical protein BL241_11545 [Ralstonia solanacearum]|uniref:Uncharacterized protein n=1 Tax=Ralstonia solanacearum TaxID=305 RepID=A0A0S4UFG3_RALSL|nr:hypothetical protein BL241_11545 [Ralstonia solanacearum]CUV20562.1 protein of unknown function [Ralstonia solanacearum]